MGSRSHSRLSRIIAPLGAFALALSLPQAAIAQSPSIDDAPAPAGAFATSSVFATESDTGLWVVALDEPALASYTGGRAGLAATSPMVTGDRSLDVSAPASVAYLNHLADQHDQFTSRAEQALGRSVEVAHEYRNVLNGMALRVSAEEAAQLAALPGVAGVYPDNERELETDVSNDLIGSAAFWDGITGPGLETRGEGIVVGMLDTGVNPHHPSFAEVDGEGYVHTNPFGSGNFVGVCDPAHPEHEDICNDKLIGAWNFNPSSPSAQDWNQHGSHVGSTIAGNIHDAQVVIGEETITRTIQGVAPRANVISYLVCFPGCPPTASVAAVNQAIADGVDVLNYSISGGDDPWNDMVDLAFLDAFNAGMFVAASAGNAGPGPSTVAKTGPWNAAIAATTTARMFTTTVDTVSPDPVPPSLVDIVAGRSLAPPIPADIEAEVRYAGEVDPGNALGCDPFAAGAFDGVIALIERGGCPFADKAENAGNAGAVALITFNNVAGGPIFLPEMDIPSVMIEDVPGQELRDFVVANPGATARIHTGVEVTFKDEWEDLVAGFSSRGPSQFEMLAPTFGAPGVNILAAAHEDGGVTDRYAIIQGTSMASPHGAGSAALLAALHPDWSPAEIRSALASTADPNVLLKEDGATAADPFDQGSGRVVLDAAARVGLVMDETHANFVAANPALGGDPKTLNLPAMVNYDCVGTCSWTRTVTSVADTTVEYTAAVDAPAGVTVTVDPANFTIAAGATQELTITAEVNGASTGEFAFGDVQLTTSGTHANGLEVADVHYPIVIVPTPPTPSVTVDPTELSSTQGPDQQVEQTLTIGNIGGAALDWELLEVEVASFNVTNDVIWDQPVSGTSGIISDFFNVFGVGVYSADDFVVPAPASVDVIHADGFWNTGSLLDATAISWFIYPDADGVPAGHPEDGQNAHVFSHSDVPTGTGIEIVDDNVTLDVVAATGGTIELDQGTYWLSVFPDINDATGDGNFRWNWSQATRQLSEAHLVDPGNLFGGGWTDWTPFSTVGVSFAGTAFRVEGIFNCTPGDIPWLHLSETSGTIAPDGSVDVTATFDSTGVPIGEHNGFLCLVTNDPDNEVVGIPVSLVVDAVPSIVITPEALAATQAADTVTDQSLTIENVGAATLDWLINQAEAVDGAAQLDPATFARVTTASSQHGDRAAAASPVIGGQVASALSVQRAPAEVMPLGDVLVTGGLSEGFDDITTLPADGWAMINNSDPLGPTDWFQGNPNAFGSHEGAPDSYIAANFLNADFIGTISNWLITPEFDLRDGDAVSFWTRASDDTFPDRMEVRLSTAGDSTDVGTTATSVGDFTEVLLEINPDLQVGGYPVAWTQFELTLDGIGDNTTGRLAFRYHVTDAGPSGFNSDYVGIDTFEFTPFDSCNQPTDISWLSVSPAAGSTPAGGSDDVTVTFDSSGLAPGEYEAQLCVESNDPVNPRVVVPVSLTVLEGVTCDQTITGTHLGPLTVSSGVTCLDGARVIGPITVHSGAGLISEDSTVVGPLSATGASVVVLTDTRVTGPVTVSGATDLVTVSDNRVTGPVSLTNNSTGDNPIVVSGNRIVGSLSCSGNQPPPTNDGVPNTVIGPKSGQCAGL